MDASVNNDFMPDDRVGAPADDGRVEVVVGVLMRGQSDALEVLIAQREASAVLGGCWEFPGGKVEPGESDALALRREMKEELGMDVRVGALLCGVDHDYEHGKISLRVYGCVLVDAVAEPLALAATRLAWVKPSALGGYAFPEANGLIVEAVQKGAVAMAAALGVGREV